MMYIKPDNMSDKDWKHWTEIGLGPCEAMVTRETCGAVSHYSACDMLEVTKPEDAVINYKVIKCWKFCEKHRRNAVHINSDATVVIGESSYKIQDDPPDE